MNIIVKLIITSVAVFMVSGCTQHKPKVVFNPPIDKTTTTEIGQNMFEKFTAFYKHDKVVKLQDNLNEKYINEVYNKSRDPQLYFKKFEDNTCSMISPFGSKYLQDKNCDGIFTHKKNGDKLIKDIEYEVVPAIPIGFLFKSFKYAVLYQGKIGNKLNISFQEFVYSINGFIIRDAFTQNIQYELDDNGEAMIGFKGLRIKVLKATNFDITYQVIKDYN